jgi:hypothetical protein
LSPEISCPPTRISAVREPGEPLSVYPEILLTIDSLTVRGGKRVKTLVAALMAVASLPVARVTPADAETMTPDYRRPTS